MKISLYTLGCKLNQAESEELKQNLLNKGFSVVPYASGEDATIIRACGVTSDASKTTREMIRRAKRNGAYIIAIGCLENKNLPEIDFIGANDNAVIKHLNNLHHNKLTLPPLSNQHGSGKYKLADKTRAFIKIQTGCNFQCAYCAIPFFRGKSRSVSLTEVIKKISQVVKNGCKEVTLTGVNICQYYGIRNTKCTHFLNEEKQVRKKIQNNNHDLANLLTEILRQTKIQRIRLGSLDPRLISKKLLTLYCRPQNKRLLPHWHLSLQSGSDNVLKRMARGYTTRQYQTIVNKLRIANPLFSFTTDIIVGFPGETEEEFNETCEFVKKIGFTKVHIFPFSPRPHTPAIPPTISEGQAAKLKPVTNRIVSERVKKLTKIAEQAASDYRKRLIGLTRPVLFEGKKNQYCEGYTPEYIKIKYQSKQNLQNKIKKIKLTSNYY